MARPTTSLSHEEFERTIPPPITQREEPPLLVLRCICGWTVGFNSHPAYGPTPEQIWEEVWWHGLDARCEGLPCADLLPGPAWWPVEYKSVENLG